MSKVLFVLAWAAVSAVLLIRAWRVGWLTMLKALEDGLAWGYDASVPLLAPVDAWLIWLWHAGGLAYLWRLGGLGYGLAMPLGLASAGVLILPQGLSVLRRRAPEIAPLTVLALPYVAALLYALRLLPTSSGRLVLQSAEIAAVTYAELVQIQSRWRLKGQRGVPLVALLLLVAAGGWALWEYIGGRTHGVTGSDPFCYVQMAVDLARRGDPRHVFTLFAQVRDLDIPWWPIVHVGYYPPGAGGLAPTVWPVGWPAFLAIAYRLLGEPGLYLGAPLAGLLALVVTFALAREVWPEAQPAGRWLGAALTVAILATSREQVLRLLVPMADVPGQLFTVLAVWLALESGRRVSWPLAALAGVALGVAYDIRHTQVLLAVVLPLALWQVRGWKQRGLLCAAMGIGACLAAAPDLWYHRVAFGSLWRPESPELYLIGLSHWWGNALNMARALAAGSEFGWLLPFLTYGFYRLWRERRKESLVLVAWIVVSAGTQFLYGPLRWRDLLGIVPALAILAAYGAIRLLGCLCAMRRPGWAPGLAALCLAFLLTLRTLPILGWPWATGEMIFGYVTAAQRQAFEQLGNAIERSAAVGTALNSGPIALYTGRETFRPGDWSPAELDRFVAAMAEAGRPVYILDDGNEHAAVVARLKGEGRLLPERAFQIPLYGDLGQVSGMFYRVRP